MFPPKTRVLVIDDMSTMRAIVSKMCREIGLTDVTTAVDGEDAWITLTEAKVPFDLIISDWNMPKISGLELLKKVKSDPRFAHLPFIMVTAESEKSQILEALKAGVDQYLMKPFNRDMFVNKMGTLVRKIKKVS